MMKKYLWNIWITGAGARGGKREMLVSHFFLSTFSTYIWFSSMYFNVCALRYLTEAVILWSCYVKKNYWCAT